MAMLERVPASAAPAQALRVAADGASRTRHRLAADPVLAAGVVLVKAFQRDRLSHTHADLLAAERYAKAAQFFLEDLYGSRDLSARDAELSRVIPALTRLLPNAALETIARAVELDWLSEQLDQQVALALAPGEAALPRLSEAQYQRAYRSAGEFAGREHQIALVGRIGAELDRLVKVPMLGTLLGAMGKPAEQAGVRQLHEFLLRGFSAFKAMRGAGEFLRLIDQREREHHRRLVQPEPA